MRALLAPAHDLEQLLHRLLDGDVERFEHPRRQPFLLAQQAEQEVLRADVVVVEAPGGVLREDDDLTRALGESLEHGRDLAPLLRRHRAALGHRLHPPVHHEDVPDVACGSRPRAKLEGAIRALFQISSLPNHSSTNETIRPVM